MKISIRTAPLTERTAIGIVLAYPELVTSTDLKAEDYYDERHKVIWQTLVDATEPLDLPALISVLESSGKLSLAGGVMYLNELTNTTQSPNQLQLMAEAIKSLSAIRKAQAVAMPVVVGEPEYAEVIEAFAKGIEIMQGTVGQNIGTSVADLIKTERERLVSVMQGRLTMRPVMTGFQRLDTIVGGFRKGQFILLAARPSVGKSALALNIARNAAELGNKILFISLEMNLSDLMCRLISAETGVISVNRLIRGALSKTGDWDEIPDLDRVDEAIKALDGLGLHIDSSQNVGLQELRAKARIHRAKHGLDLLIVDYLGLMKAPDGNSRYAEISALSRGLKLLAEELDVPMLVLAQLNRNLEYNSKRLPRLSDLRDSGSLEQDADVVILLDRELPSDGNSEPTEDTTVLVAKNRNGPTDQHTLRYIGKLTKFVGA